ncbi:NAC domain-containing protein [Forsythia ovata]|uniref:NAC domain-containing protein n=1 Tax=Forsythia ovata TaxID=205694 RepID=A0ABD1WWE3_9LAMI
MENQSMKFDDSLKDQQLHYLNSSKFSSDEYLNNFPPGFHFRPTKKELIMNNLIKKINNDKMYSSLIKDVDLYKFNLENLKATVVDKTILHNGEVIGCEKSLVFYRGKPPLGVKTSWLMHEFKVNNIPPRQRSHEDDMRVGLLKVDGYYNYLFNFIDKAVDDGSIKPSQRYIFVSAPQRQRACSKTGGDVSACLV